MLSAVPAWLPIGVVKAVHADAFAGGYVNELVFAEIDAAVRCAFFIGRKEYKIAGLKFGAFFDAFAKRVLFVGGTGEGEAVLFENVLDKSGTVKALWRRTAENVPRSDVFFCSLDNGVHFAFWKERRLFGNFFRIWRRICFLGLVLGFSLFRSRGRLCGRLRGRLSF